MFKYLYLAVQQHRVVARGRLVGRMNIEGLRGGSYWV